MNATEYNIETSLSEDQFEKQVAYFLKTIGSKTVRIEMHPYLIAHIRNVEKHQMPAPQNSETVIYEAAMYGGDGHQTAHDPNEDE